MSAAVQGVIAQVQDSFPPSGTALLCAAGALIPAKAKRDAEHTMFSEGLLDILNQGAPTAAESLSISDLAAAIRNELRIRYADEAVRPEVHSPEQPKGSVAEVPLFRNARAAIQGIIAPISNKIAVRNPNYPSLQSTLSENFLREFEDTDFPPKIGIYISDYDWERVPKPVKIILKEYEESRRISAVFLILLLPMSIVAFVNISCMLFVSTLSPNTILIRSIGDALLTLSAISMALLSFWVLFILVTAKRTIDRRVLRSITGESESWEKSDFLNVLRKPRDVLVFRNKIYLRPKLRLVTIIALSELSVLVLVWIFLLIKLVR